MRFFPSLTIQLTLQAVLISAVLVLLSLPRYSWASACLIEVGTGAANVKLCQHNRSIPANLFKDGFCQPQLSGQKAKVTMLDECPTGAFGVCRNAQTAGAQIPYQQDIYYYGTSSDARFLQPACKQQNNGSWQPLTPTGEQH